MRALARFVAGRRTKWLVVGAWLAVLVAFAPLGGRLADVTDNRTETFLPTSTRTPDPAASEPGRRRRVWETLGASAHGRHA